jgi:predicted RNA binding protein YcfA (HicA-like mRNA interferase family)
MARMPRITGSEMITALGKAGFSPVRQKGSHVRLKHEDGRVTTVSVHSGKILGAGLLLKILRDTELTSDDLMDLLD